MVGKHEHPIGLDNHHRGGVGTELLDAQLDHHAGHVAGVDRVREPLCQQLEQRDPLDERALLLLGGIEAREQP